MPYISGSQLPLRVRKSYMSFLCKKNAEKNAEKKAFCAVLPNH